MRALYFPRKEYKEEQNALLFSPDKLAQFRASGEELEKKAEKLTEDYLKNPLSVSQADVAGLAKDAYRLTVELFEQKMAMGETLLAEEKAIYELCRREVSRNYEWQSQDNDNSFFGALFNAIELIRNCIDQIKDWFDISSEKDKAGMRLAKAGNQLLPAYATLVEGFFVTIGEFFAPVFTPTVIGVTEAQAECALHYQEKRTVDKTLASSMLQIAGCAYEGCGGSMEGYGKLSAGELPEGIRALYDESKGLLTSSRGLQVWLGKKGNQIVVSYSGTDPSNFDMVYADIIQLSAPSVLYLKAAGLLKLLRDYMTGKSFYVTGHSLGGGLTQFSVTANKNLDTDKIEGYGYNPAGLSMISLRHLGETRLKRAKKAVWMFMTCMDPVSAVGGKIGCLTTLPKTDKNGHGMADLKVCMKKYLETPSPAPLSCIDITWRNHDYEKDFIPYTRKLSFKDDKGNIYPVFNDNAASESEEFIHAKIPGALFKQFQISGKTCDYCMGVYNKFNGTAHTVMNRLLLLGEEGPVITTGSIGNIHSSIIYGKFGLGMQEFIPMLQKAYADSGESAAGSRDSYEKVLSKLNNPFEYDKQAWCEGIRIQFGINMYSIFGRYPYAESYFNTFLNKVTSDRMDIYRSLFKGTAPSRKDIQSFLRQLKQSVLTEAGKLMDEAVRWNIITAGDKTDYCNAITAFSDMVIEKV